MTAETPQPGDRVWSVEEILDDLRARVVAGEWAPWEKLPSQTALSTHYGRRRADGALHRVTQQLHGEGWILNRQGTESAALFGREVIGITVSTRPWVGDERVSEHVLAFDGRGQRRRCTERRTTVPIRLADVAGLEPGADVVERVVRVSVDRRPVLVSISYLPVELTSPDDGSAWHAADIGQLAIVGHAAPPTRHRARTELPGPHERDMLDLAPGSPMLIVSSQYVIGDDELRAAVVVLADGVRVDLELPLGD